MGVDIHIVAVGSRSFVAQMALRYAPGHLVVLLHSNILPRLGPSALGHCPSVGPPALPATLGPSALGVTDLSGLIQRASPFYGKHCSAVAPVSAAGCEP